MRNRLPISLSSFNTPPGSGQTLAAFSSELVAFIPPGATGMVALRATHAQLDGFQIAGAVGKFEWANAVVISTNKVKVWSRKVNNPTAVRYAWDDNPSYANLKNKEGLPASSFTTVK